jgi:hypothetical protein
MTQICFSQVGLLALPEAELPRVINLGYNMKRRGPLAVSALCTAIVLDMMLWCTG